MRAVAAAIRKSGLVTLTPDKVDGGGQDAAKDYIDRVRAYIPVEVVAFFIFVNSGVLGKPLWAKAKVAGQDSILTTDGWVALLALIIGAAGSVLVTYIAAKRAGQPWLVQAVVTVIAFLVWTYALGARAFEVLPVVVSPSLASLLLASFTFFSGLIVPVKKG